MQSKSLKTSNKPEKYSIEIRIHCIYLKLASPTELLISWKTKKSSIGKRISITNKAIHISPSDDRVDINDTLDMELFLYKKSDGFFLGKQIVLKVKTEKNMRTIGRVEIDFNRILDLPVEPTFFPIKKCKDIDASICLTMTATLMEASTADLMVKEFIRSKERYHDLIYNLHHEKKRLQRLHDKIESTKQERDDSYKETIRLQDETEVFNLAIQITKDKIVDRKNCIDRIEYGRLRATWNKKNHLNREVNLLQDQLFEADEVLNMLKNNPEIMKLSVLDMKEKLEVLEEENQMLSKAEKEAELNLWYSSPSRTASVD